MRPEYLARCLEQEFAGLSRPALEEMAAADTYVDQSFIDGVGLRPWQELRPLRRYVGDASDIVLLSAKAYQYYLPAYLYALIDPAGDEFYLTGVLDSLWYESLPGAEDDRIAPWFSASKGGWQELMPELEQQMPELTDQQRRHLAARRFRIAKGLAHIKGTTDSEWIERPLQRARWEERMPLLTNPQKNCIAGTLVHILDRTTDVSDAGRIQTMLNGYWRAFLVDPGD